MNAAVFYALSHVRSHEQRARAQEKDEFVCWPFIRLPPAPTNLDRLGRPASRCKTSDIFASSRLASLDQPGNMRLRPEKIPVLF